jgi:hypothetical protein
VTTTRRSTRTTRADHEGTKKTTSDPRPVGQALAAALVDPKLKARWESALARYRSARADETAGWDQRYEALGEIIDSEPPYYLAGGYRDATSFLKVEAPGQELRTVRRYVRVARHFEPEHEVRYGITKLDALIDYLEAVGKSAPLPPAKIDLARQKVRVPDGKAQRVLLFADATVEELQRARRAAQAKSRPAAPALSPIARRVQEALARAKLQGIAVGLRGGALHLGGIPLAQVPALGKALAAVKIA